MNVFTNLKQNETVVLLNCPISAYLHGVKKTPRWCDLKLSMRA